MISFGKTTQCHFVPSECRRGRCELCTVCRWSAARNGGGHSTFVLSSLGDDGSGATPIVVLKLGRFYLVMFEETERREASQARQCHANTRSLVVPALQAHHAAPGRLQPRATYAQYKRSASNVTASPRPTVGAVV